MFWPYHPLVIYCFSPLAHLAERLNVYSTALSGGRVGLISGDVQHVLFEDMQYATQYTSHSLSIITLLKDITTNTTQRNTTYL